MPENPPKPSEFSELLTTQKDFPVCVKQAFKSEATHAPRVDLLYVRFKEATVDVEGLAEIISHQVVNYALPKRKIRELLSKADGSMDLSQHSKLIAEAKRAFIAFNPSATTTQALSRYAEIGEVLAFCVASHFLEAGQVAAKMALKTNSEMPVFGLDGIHVRKEEDGTVTVYFLEAKMVGEAKSGGEQYSKSAGGFDKDRAHKLNEQRIARDLSNLDILEDDARESALNYFDPYSQAQGNMRERFVGIIVHTEPGYQKTIPVSDANPPNAHEQHFLKGYKDLQPTFTADLEKALKKEGVELGKCRAFFIAVPDVDKLKTLFAEAMSGGHIRK